MAPEIRATALLIGGLVLAAAVTDVWKGKIYNWLTLPALLVAPVWHTVAHPQASTPLGGLLFSLQGFAVAALVLAGMGLIAGRGLGGGDIKLLVAVGALGGTRFVLWALLFTALSGPVVAVPVMIRRRIVGYTLRNLAANMAARYAAGRSEVAVSEGSRGGRVPFGICICIGTLVALVYPGLQG